MKLTYFGLLTLSAVSAQRISRKQAASLFRRRRDNGGVFEELKSPNLERECIEESCSFQELKEASDNDAAADAFWKDATERCSAPGACNSQGTMTCTNEWRNHICTCRDGFENTEEKQDCSTDRDECAIDGWCANGAECTNTFGSFTCACPAGWGGARCDEDIDECASGDACKNGGECTNTEGSFTCLCTEFWTGPKCEEDVNECAVDNPCIESDCINLEGSYECLCTGGKGGKHCDEDYDECGANLCPEGSQCISMDEEASFGAFKCVCPERGCNNLDENKYNEKVNSVYNPDAVEEIDEVELVDANSTSVEYAYENSESVYDDSDSVYDDSVDETLVEGVSYDIEEYEEPSDDDMEDEIETAEYDATIELPVEEEIEDYSYDSDLDFVPEEPATTAAEADYVNDYVVEPTAAADEFTEAITESMTNSYDSYES